MVTDIKPGSQIKVRVAFEDDDGPKGERLWARFMGNGLAKIENIPFIATELSEGDTVRINEALEVVEVVEKAANTRCLRFSVPEDEDEALSLAKIIGAHFEDHEIHVEFGVPGLGSIAVPLFISEEQLEKVVMECPVKIELFAPSEEI